MKGNILYVEDDAINAFVVIKLLGKDYSVRHCEDGESGIELLTKEKIDLVLMDINLGRGKMDGIETMKLIKSNLNYKTLPVVALTSYALPEDRGRFLEEGFNDYIPKPVDRNTLLKHIQKFL